MKIVRDSDIEKLKVAAGKKISDYLSEYSSQPVLLLLAGGSSLDILRFVDFAVISGRVTIGMFDERFSLDPAVNNFSQLMATEFYAGTSKRGANFLDSRVREGETLVAFGDRIESALKDWATENPEGIALATFGIGADGHTGGMMPFPEDPRLFAGRFESDRWYFAYDAGKKDKYNLRASTTMTFIRKMIKARVIFAAGENKRAALERVFSEKGTLAGTPARIHREAADAILFTDLDIKKTQSK